jgi:hypothetical protein
MSTELAIRSAVTKGIKKEGDVMLDNVIALIQMDNYTITSFSVRDGYEGPVTQIRLKSGNNVINLEVVEGRS